MTRSALAAKTASGGRAISGAAASLGNAALANAPKQGGYFGDGTPRCRRPYCARLANAGRALNGITPIGGDSPLQGRMC
eukprot:279225-Chlamydomonas_euryale.AAC.1